MAISLVDIRNPIVYTQQFFQGGSTIGRAVSTNPLTNFHDFSIQVHMRIGPISEWTINLEGSNDGTNWTTVLTHDIATGNGATKSGPGGPFTMFRSNVTLIFGAGANPVTVTIAGYHSFRLSDIAAP